MVGIKGEWKIIDHARHECFVMTCHICHMSCHMSCPVICHVWSSTVLRIALILFYSVLIYPILSYHVKSYHIKYVLSCPFISYRCHIMSCHMSSHVIYMSCQSLYVMSDHCQIKLSCHVQSHVMSGPQQCFELLWYHIISSHVNC